MTTRPPADTRSAALLSLIWPGLGQLYQGRFSEALHFLIESGLLAFAIAASDKLRLPASLLLAVIAVWSIADAIRAEQKPPRAVSIGF